MSARRLWAAGGLARVSQLVAVRRQLHYAQRARHQLPSSNVLSRHGLSRRWPAGAYAIHNLPATRTISFARVLPKLATKLLRIPAMFGGAMIAGLAYLQYQAAQAGTYVMDQIRRAGDTASTTASSIWSSASGVAEQAWTGFERTREDVSDSFHTPSWLTNLFSSGEGNGSGNDDGPSGGKSPQQGKATAAGVATGAAYGYSQTGDDDEQAQDEDEARDDQMMVLTRKMIEIRSILQQVGQSDSLNLPSIVVIGSQSSGKSSVLEAIVGHEFLPKGSNMVTRRPIELTLVNTPEGSPEYGEFPTLGLGQLSDFSSIQKTLTDLNLAVPAKDCVTDDPIRLSIYSPNVPDLSMIDLPGYIQVVGADQPLELKQRIADLCDKYIQPPNIILAISAADVDLANSTALRASRRVDPRGERTIGVVTKMDLVEPPRGASILNDKKYPLRLGYVGVISKVPQSTSIFSRGPSNITSAVTRNENTYFSSHPLEYGPTADVNVGTNILRKKLMHVLETTMAHSLQDTTEAIRQELEEATYEFKVQYNDRPLSAESYLAESLDSFKHSFKILAESFGRPQVRELLKAELDQRVLDLLAQRYWNKPVTDLAEARPELNPISNLSDAAAADSPYWQRQLDASSSALTKSGIGRLATNVVANALQTQIDGLVTQSTFATHPFAREAIASAASSILNDRFYSTSDQVENCIKPYKFEIEVDDSEWTKARTNTAALLQRELRECEAAERALQESVGGKRRLKEVTSFIDRVRKGDVALDGSGAGGAGGFSAALLQKGREAYFLQARATMIHTRLLAIKSRGCASKTRKYQCPEIFLDAVADKLTSTAVLFLNVELLTEFYYHFPRELDRRLGRSRDGTSTDANGLVAGLGDAEVERFAREDPRIARHLDVVRRKDLLELVLQKCESLRSLDAQIPGSNSSGSRNGDKTDSRSRTASREKGRGWSLFK